MRFVTVLKKPN